MSPDQRTLVFVPLALVAFVALVASTKLYLGTSGLLSLVYLVYAAIWGAVLKSVAIPEVKLDTPEAITPMLVLVSLGTLINVAGGLYAYVDFWSTREMHASYRIIVITLIASLPIFAVAKMVESK